MTEHDCRAVYPDRACFRTVTIQQNTLLARDSYRLRFECPEIARQVLPGQFVMVRLAGYDDPVLGRALACYDTHLSPSGAPVGIELVYVVVGKMTRKLAEFAPGQKLEVWGPLGNGFPPQPAEHLVMVAGGIGQTPFLTLAREAQGLRAFGEPPREAPKAGKVTLCYGARSRDYLRGVSDFESLGVEVRVSTEDGTAGHRGLVTEVLEEVVAGSSLACRVVACGPEPMLAAVAATASRLGVPCQVTLESPMACGMGICFSCVVRVRDGSGGWDYRRTCVEGPVFDAQQIEFS
ncbi:MAG: dihydroorotate dehydrogenase electron transfer subunit [Pirellulales bacterium]